MLETSLAAVRNVFDSTEHERVLRSDSRSELHRHDFFSTSRQGSIFFFCTRARHSGAPPIFSTSRRKVAMKTISTSRWIGSGTTTNALTEKAKLQQLGTKSWRPDCSEADGFLFQLIALGQPSPEGRLYDRYIRGTKGTIRTHIRAEISRVDCRTRARLCLNNIGGVNAAVAGGVTD